MQTAGTYTETVQARTGAKQSTRQLVRLAPGTGFFRPNPGQQGRTPDSGLTESAVGSPRCTQSDPQMSSAVCTLLLCAPPNPWFASPMVGSNTAQSCFVSDDEVVTCRKRILRPLGAVAARLPAFFVGGRRTGRTFCSPLSLAVSPIGPCGGRPLCCRNRGVPRCEINELIAASLSAASSPIVHIARLGELLDFRLVDVAVAFDVDRMSDSSLEYR